MANSKTFQLLIGLLFAIVVLVSSAVAARELSTEQPRNGEVNNNKLQPSSDEEHGVIPDGSVYALDGHHGGGHGGKGGGWGGRGGGGGGWGGRGGGGGGWGSGGPGGGSGHGGGGGGWGGRGGGWPPQDQESLYSLDGHHGGGHGGKGGGGGWGGRGGGGGWGGRGGGGGGHGGGWPPANQEAAATVGMDNNVDINKNHPQVQEKATSAQKTPTTSTASESNGH